MEIHTAQLLLVLETSACEFETGIAKFTIYILPCSDHILAKLIQAGAEKLWSEIHKLINSIWNKEEFLEQWKESIAVPIYIGQ
jgi:hypothetical protein